MFGAGLAGEILASLVEAGELASPPPVKVFLIAIGLLGVGNGAADIARSRCGP
jgi:hypothetical protein